MPLLLELVNLSCEAGTVATVSSSKISNGALLDEFLGSDQVTGQVRGESFPPSLDLDVTVEKAGLGEVVVVGGVVPDHVPYSHLNNLFVYEKKEEEK